MQIRGTSAHQKVALLAEGVDRNLFPFRLFAVTAKVALLAEGVDRNFFSSSLTASVLYRSPSSRRAWIEMVHPNTGGNNCASPSSRRAWIEIFFPLALYVNFTVALLAEGVDRNLYFSS